MKPINLDSTEDVLRLDKGNVLGSIRGLSSQCEDAWNQTKEIILPDSYKEIKNIVMCGMGGSGLGARVIESLYQNKLAVPLVRINDYHIPEFVNEKSLVICSSYSGNTEETVSNFYDALEKNAKIIVVAAGGKLIELAKSRDILYLKITPNHNPSNQPRMAIGYSVVGQLAMISKTGYVDFSKDDVKTISNVLNSLVSKLDTNALQHENSAKQLASQLYNRIIFYVSSEHLVGGVHVVNNQLNENAKVVSMDFQIPELNHHLMEGLKNPMKNSENIMFVFANSKLYSRRITKRHLVTKDVLDKNQIAHVDIELESETKISQVFELIQYGAFVNYYLSILYGENPSPIPWVDYFKDKLGD